MVCEMGAAFVFSSIASIRVKFSLMVPFFPSVLHYKLHVKREVKTIIYSHLTVFETHIYNQSDKPSTLSFHRTLFNNQFQCSINVKTPCVYKPPSMNSHKPGGCNKVATLPPTVRDQSAPIQYNSDNI